MAVAAMGWNPGVRSAGLPGSLTLAFPWAADFLSPLLRNSSLGLLPAKSAVPWGRSVR